MTSAIEHKGVLAAAARLGSEGFRVREVGVNRGGVVDLDQLDAALDDRTAVVSVMLVNNEVGTVQPLPEIAARVRARAPHALLHTDAVQAVPWLDVAEAAAGFDLVAISGHKFGGPKGVGVLVVRDGVTLEPEIEGGGQERGLRAGTVNVAGVVALATALRVTHERRKTDVDRVLVLHDRLARGLAASVPSIFFNGDADRKVAGNCHVGFAGVESEALLLNLDAAGVSAATGSRAPPVPRTRARACRDGPLPRRCIASVRLAWASRRRTPMSPPRSTSCRRARRAAALGGGGMTAPAERVLVPRGRRGRDSSVAATLLVEAGHDVTGVTLKLWGGESDSGCGVSAWTARHVAAQLDIPHYVFNFTDDFEANVVTPYTDTYAAVAHAEPGVECNRTMKFGASRPRQHDGLRCGRDG